MNKPILALMLMLLLPSPSSADDDDLRALIKDLSRQIQQLTQRVNDLEHQLDREKHAREHGSTAEPPVASTAAKSLEKPPRAPVATVEPTKPTSPAKRDTQSVAVGDIKGSIKIPGTDTSLALGGYAKLDVLYSSINAGAASYGDQFLVLSSIPVGAARLGKNSQTALQAKESRIWLKSFTPSRLGDISTYLELDFYGSPESYTARLRHGFGSLGPLLAGQTWTTFLNVSAIPETLDIGGPIGIGLVKQPMLRWTQPFALAGHPLEFQAALESPDTRLAIPDNPTIVSPDDNRYPDLIARFNFNPDWGELSLAAAGRQIRFSPAGAPALSQWGGAISMGGKIKTVGLDNMRFTLSYGNALGRYATLYAFADAVTNSAATVLDLAQTSSAMLSYQHWWNNEWRSTVAYGFAQAELPSFANSGLTRQGQSAHVNLLWSPFLQTTFGLEYIYATRSVESGPYGDLQRVQFSSRVNF